MVGRYPVIGFRIWPAWLVELGNRRTGETELDASLPVVIP